MRMNELFRYDLDKNNWTIQETTGRQPTARCHHSAFYEDPYLFIYSGQGDSGRSLGDFYVLHVTTWEWKRLFMLQAPPLRHCTTISDIKNSEKEKVIFGGVSWPGNKLLNDVWVVNYNGVDFTSGMKELTGTVCTLKKTKGDIPAPRKGHSAAVNNRSLFIYGGKGEEFDSTNWIHQLSFDSWTWKKIAGIARPQNSRYFASCCLMEDDNLFIFGGICNKTGKRLNDIAVLNLQDFHWSNPFAAGHSPTPRYNHAAVVCDTPFHDKAMLILGGLDNIYCNMDFYKLIETELRDKVQWEILKRPTQMETLAGDVAGATLLDQRNYMDELDHIISHERTYGLELEQELERLEEEIKQAQIEHVNKIKLKEAENQALEEELALTEEIRENSLIGIVKEEKIFEGLVQKGVQLEDVIQHTESYLVSLDKLFSAITKLKFHDTDIQDRTLKQLSEGCKDEVSKAKELHKGSLQGLKSIYDEFVKFGRHVELDIVLQRNVVLDVDRTLEDILVNKVIPESS